MHAKWIIAEPKHQISCDSNCKAGYIIAGIHFDQHLPRNKTMNFSFHYAQTQAELDAVYQLRYNVYVEEMHIFGDMADHQNQLLSGPNDATARILYATVNDEIVGSLRLNLGKDAPFSDELEDTYNLQQFRGPVDDDKMLVLTRFMVKPSYRGTSLAHQMICQVAELCLAEGVEVSFCDCQPHLVRYYQRMGFRSYACSIYNDPEFGIMIPLVFINGDLKYLKTIRSPLKAIFEQRTCNTPLVQRCLDKIGIPSVQNIAELVGAERTLLMDSLSEIAPLFEGLDADEVDSIIAPGHLIDLSYGDRLIRKGQPAQTMFILLAGWLEMRDGDRVIGRLYPGAIAGELSLLLSDRRTVDVYVGTPQATLISLEEGKLKKKFKSRSSSTSKLLLNLSKTLARKLSTLTTRGPEEFVFPLELTSC